MSIKAKAFPISYNWAEDEFNGMDLRDYFAIHAPEQVNSLTWAEVKKYLKLDERLDIDDWTDDMTLLVNAKKRYEFADAMMEARKL